MACNILLFNMIYTPNFIYIDLYFIFLTSDFNSKFCDFFNYKTCGISYITYFVPEKIFLLFVISDKYLFHNEENLYFGNFIIF